MLAAYLLHYDEQESTILLNGFTNGFSLHYEGPHNFRTSGNHRSALQAQSLVDDKLIKEISLGRIAGPFTTPPFTDFHSSPLGLIPKHDLGKFRLIHDLSFPQGDSINFHTSKQFTSVQYETLDHVVDLVHECGQGCFIAKADIKDAFRLIPINPQDYHLLGMTWNGQFYYDKVLPMGSAISCQTFERFSRAVQWILQQQFAVDSVTHLLDDFIFVSENESVCHTYLQSFEQLSLHLGIPLNQEKTCLPSTCQTVYGIEVDTLKLELRLPADKLAKATMLVDRLAKRRTVTLRDLQGLIGFLSFCCLAIACGRPFLRRLIQLTRGITRPHHYVTLNSEARADLQAWNTFLCSFNGKCMFLDHKFLSSDTIKLYTDASSDIGFAAIFGKKWVAGKWHRSFSSADITLLELYPLVLLTGMFGDYFANHCILFMTDNAGVVEIVNKLSSKNQQIMKLVRMLVLFCLKYNILFRCQHVPGYQNIIADHLSRFQIDEAKRAARWLDAEPSVIPESLRPTMLLD